MQPTQPSSSLDYLNQIAPKAPKKSLLPQSSIIRMLLIGAGAIVLILIAVGVFSLINSNRVKPLHQLTARLTTTETLAIDARDKLKSSQLRSLNSSLSLNLAGINRDLAEPFKKAGADPSRISNAIKEEESGDPIAARLEDARLNAVYDRTYAREMAYLLETTLSLMKKVYSSTGNNDLKDFLTTTYNNLEPAQQAFADFNAANG